MRKINEKMDNNKLQDKPLTKTKTDNKNKEHSKMKIRKGFGGRGGSNPFLLLGVGGEREARSKQ